MKVTKLFVACVALASIFAISGCASTLFFPAKPAEKAADKVIDDIWPDLSKPGSQKVEAKKS